MSVKEKNNQIASSFVVKSQSRKSYVDVKYFMFDKAKKLFLVKNLTKSNSI